MIGELAVLVFLLACVYAIIAYCVSEEVRIAIAAFFVGLLQSAIAVTIIAVVWHFVAKYW